MNTFEKKRHEAIESILAEWQCDDPELVDDIAELLDKEIRAAFGRGFREGKGKSNTGSSYGKGSAVKAGKVRPSDGKRMVEFKDE